MIANRIGRDRASTHAVVIGGSMAGMLAARILADHFDQVTVIERDRFPDAANSRNGVPQSRHLHVLLERGRLILERLFPGLTAELIADGASLVDTAADFAILNPAGWAVQFPSGIGMMACSRDLLDWHVRRHVRALPPVQFLPETDVAGLVPTSDRSDNCGVIVRRHGEQSADRAGDETLHADLVVDASGRGSRSPKWLEALGYPAVNETVVNAFVGYASRVVRRPAALPAGHRGIFLQAAPPKHNRAGVAFPIEGDRWIVTLSGGGRDYPPADEAGFLRFLRSLRSPILYNALKDAEPLTPIAVHRGGENRIRHFEQMPAWPERFVVMGDAVCSFNPVYGQGMTIAALSAEALSGCLTEQRHRRAAGDLTGLARRFQCEVGQLNALPWMLSTSEDLRYAAVEGTRPRWTTRLLHRYVDCVLRLNTTSPIVRKRSLQVFHMLKSPAALFHPGTIARALWQLAKSPARPNAVEPAIAAAPVSQLA